MGILEEHRGEACIRGPPSPFVKSSRPKESILGKAAKVRQGECAFCVSLGKVWPGVGEGDSEELQGLVG